MLAPRRTAVHAPAVAPPVARARPRRTASAAQAAAAAPLARLPGVARPATAARPQPGGCVEPQCAKPELRRARPAARSPPPPLPRRSSHAAAAAAAAAPLRAAPWACIAARRRGGRLVLAAAAVGAGGAPAAAAAAAAAAALLDAHLEPHPALEVGHLPNGLRYVLLPNQTPPGRFEAHLEVHAGSVDEGPDEQGIAHLVEHVTFLGSKRREALLGTGARSNAYTDFHHTVFHVHAPCADGATGAPMLPAVLDALAEIAFSPEFLPSRLEKERKAVVAEAQMMNTIEYRVDCRLLAHLHWENALGCRFPIGRTEQVERWARGDVVDFWRRHYSPANATVYVVGDVAAGEARALVEAAFGGVPTALPAPPAPPPGEVEAPRPAATLLAPPPAAAQPPPHAADAAGPLAAAAAAAAFAASPPGGALLRPAGGAAAAGLGRQAALRPPVQHAWGFGAAERAAPVSVFRHRLLQLFQLSVFCKLPVRPMGTLGDLRRAFIARVLLSVFQFRVNARYVAADPPFVGIELDHSDSGREGCAVSTLTVTAEPADWRGAVAVAVQEVRRLQRHGVTPSELDRYKAALLRDSEQLAEGADAVPSADNLDFVMESLALGHAVLDQRAAHGYLVALADSVTVEEANALARSLLSFASHFRSEAALLREFEADPSGWAPPGPTVTTAAVACLPAFMDASGHGTGGAAPAPRGASLATTQHVDPEAAAAAAAAADDDGAGEEPPEGAVRFLVDASDIEAALAEEGLPVEAPPDVDVPDDLLSYEEVARLVAERRPAFVPIDGAPGGDATPPPDAATGVVQRRLANGVRVNYRLTSNEPRGAMVRVVAAGGRAREAPGAGPAGHGAVAVGTRALSEAGTVGPWAREQVELFCISRLINCVLEADEEFVAMDFHFAVGGGGLPAVLQLLHLFLEAPRWEAPAAERAKQMYLSHYRSLDKSLERATADRIMAAMFGADRRFRDPTPEEIDALSLEGMRAAVSAQLLAGNLEVSVVGDVDPVELEEGLLKYIGTVQARPEAAAAAAAAPPDAPPTPAAPPPEERHQVWHLRDSDERACAYIAGPAPNRWGNFTPAQQAARAAARGAPVAPPPPPPPPGAPPAELAAAADARRAHPLYAAATLAVLTEVMNSRLFTTVRDTLGLTYDVSFELSLFDRLPAGWFHASVTSTPDKIGEALTASLRVLRSGVSQPFAPRELARARRTLAARHETDLKDNGYWLSLLTHLQADGVPLKSVECLRDLLPMYEAVTVHDLQDAYAQFDFSTDKVFTCIGTSGREAPAGRSPLLKAPAAAAATPPDADKFISAFAQFVSQSAAGFAAPPAGRGAPPPPEQ
jgi:predicted Zn-dependent peptidase